MNIPYQHIAIEGNIGAGKTSFSEKLASDLNAQLVLEQFQENPFLELFYKEKERYAFQVELFFLADRHQQIKQMNVGNLFSNQIISDYIFDKCFIFARNNLKDLEFKLYQHLYEILKGSIAQPDLIVFLDCSTEKLLENIQKRGRNFEKNISAEYLNELRNSYISHFKQSDNKRVLILNTDDYDFVSNKVDYNRLKGFLLNDYPIGLTYQ